MNNTIELTRKSFTNIENICERNALYQKGTFLDQQKIFTTWITDYEKLIRHIILGFEAKPAIQDELFQEIALNIWRALPNFRQQSQVKTFIARIAHNILATHVSKAIKTVKAQSSIEDITQLDFEAESPQKTPFQMLDQNQRQQRLVKAIRQLKLDQQQVITLALEGMNYQEIAEVLSISVSLVGVRLTRSKSALSKLLEV